MSSESRLFYATSVLAPGHGGIGRLARMVAKAMRQRGTGFQAASLHDAGPVTIENQAIRGLSGSKLRMMLATYRAALSGTRHFMYDSQGLMRAHPRWPVKPKSLLWMLGIEAWDLRQPWRRKIFESADRVIAISHFTRDRHAEVHGALPKTEICWLGTEQEEMPARTADFSGPPTVLAVGRLDKDEKYSKGQRELILEWPAIVAAVPDARLLIAGGGSGLEATRALAAASSVAANIEVLGFVPEDAMDDLYARAHIFAMPSRGEGFGIVYAEAMRLGLPVIASIHDAGAEVNVDGETGYNVDLNRKGDLADKIVALLRDPLLLQRFGANGLKRWDKTFRFSAFRDRVGPLIDEFLSS